LNSRGTGGLLSATGSASIAANDLTLEASGLPQNFAVVILALDETCAVLGDGLAAIQPGLYQTGILRGGVQLVDPAGVVTFGPGAIQSVESNLGMPGLITAGSTWHFQVAYRASRTGSSARRGRRPTASASPSRTDPWARSPAAAHCRVADRGSTCPPPAPLRPRATSTMRPSSCPAALRSAAACLSATLLVSAGTATAQVAVSVLPGYPNAPTLTPAERVLARDGVSLRLWGNVERGESAPAGATYEWYIAPNGNVSVGSDGDLTGPVTDPDDVREDVVLTLLNGSTREILTATLIVTDPADPTGGGQRTVEILLLGDDDPDVDTPLEELEIDARLAIQRALWFIYDRQELFGDWHIPSRQNLASTSFVLWALQNRGHSDRNDRDEDIFARPIARGYDYMFANFGEEFTDPADLTAGRAT
ncbi:MAG: hypothetical protein AAFZ87_18565, partial [Planctomycetota bacterium]